MMQQPRIGIIGDWLHADFAAAREWLESRAEIEFCEAADGALVADIIRASLDAVLFVQSRPGEVSSRFVENIHAMAPLARLVALTGPWCEGELRNGRAWPGVVRISWRQWPTRLARELGFDNSAGMHAHYPRTLTDGERIEREVAALRSTPLMRGSASVLSDRPTSAAGVAAALQRLGFSVIREAHSADVILHDGWPTETILGAQTARRLLLILDFPRPDDIDRARILGFHAVLAQPLRLADLAAALSPAAMNNAIRQAS
jgi:hypothetical protein